MCRNLLFYILGVFWTIKILLLTFCHEGPQMLHAKFGANQSNHVGGVRKSTFFICRNFENGKLPQKWAWPTTYNSAEFREQVNINIDIELLCISLRPFYLPRDFGNIVMCSAYPPVIMQPELQLVLQTVSTIKCNAVWEPRSLFLEILTTVNWNCPFLDLNYMVSVALQTIECWTNVMGILEMHTVPDQSPLCQTQTIIQSIWYPPISF